MYAAAHTPIQRLASANWTGLTHVEYSYDIGARHFESTHFTYQPTSGLSEGEVTQMLRNLTEGSEVDVYYDPARACRSNSRDLGRTFPATGVHNRYVCSRDMVVLLFRLVAPSARSLSEAWAVFGQEETFASLNLTAHSGHSDRLRR
jgi:hypothetical protein